MLSRKRRTYLIKRAFQLKYTGIILFFILLTSAVSVGVVYISILPYLSEKLANIYPQGRLVTILKDANARLLLSSLLLLPVAVWIGVILSHRIAGPWYRMENILRDIAEGRLIEEVRLRKRDELQSLADAINDVIGSIKYIRHENLTYIQSLDETLQSLKQELERETIDPMKARLLLSKLQDISTDLRNLAKKYVPAP